MREQIPKLKAVDALAYHHILEKEDPERIIIVVERLPMGLFLEAYLRSQGYKVLSLHAGTTPSERNDICQMWTLESK